MSLWVEALSMPSILLAQANDDTAGDQWNICGVVTFGLSAAAEHALTGPARSTRGLGVKQGETGRRKSESLSAMV